MQTTNIDNRTLFLMGNGDVSAKTSQEIYELAWENGIRPINEAKLKPQRFRKARRWS